MRGRGKPEGSHRWVLQNHQPRLSRHSLQASLGVPFPGTQRAFNLGILHLAVAFLGTMRMASFLWMFDDSCPESSSLYIIHRNRHFQNLEPNSTCLLDLSNGPIQQMNNQGGKRQMNTCFYQGKKTMVMRTEQWIGQQSSLIGKPGWPVSPREPFDSASPAQSLQVL